MSEQTPDEEAFEVWESRVAGEIGASLTDPVEAESVLDSILQTRQADSFLVEVEQAELEDLRRIAAEYGVHDIDFNAARGAL
uniref:hypothetical protein n=1 Tax=Streptomyces chartreusis TaxID=1969 RepID=UPI003F49A5EA